MDYYGKFLEEKYAGKYSGCRYPNLVEIHGGMPTDYFAEVTPELMLAVFRGEEDLTAEEIGRIAYYNHIPLSVLTCPKLIMLDMGRRRHRKMAEGVDNLYIQLKNMAGKGNREAKKYLEYADWKRSIFTRAVEDNKLSYGHYRTVNQEFTDYIAFSTPKPKLRGIR